MSIEARNRSLSDWFTRIRTHQTVLPRFQRFEAWDYSRVTQLFNTILQDLPVGSALVLEIGDEEPFISRTLKGAPEMGERLAEREVHPDRIYTSSALRARTTAKIIAEVLDYPAEDIDQVESLYHAGVSTWLDFISGLEDSLSCVMCFGHNPGLTELAHFEFGCELSDIPTCGVLTLDFATDHWAKVPGTQPDRVDFDYPKKKPTN